MLILALTLAAAQPAVAPAPVSETGALTTLLDEHDYDNLARVLNTASSPTAFWKALDWERDQMIQGASAFVAFRYATDLWQVADLRKDDDIMQTAAFAMLYAVVAETIDGKRCADVSAPGHRLDESSSSFRPIMIYLRSAPIETRRKLVELAVRLDSKTANLPSRRNDWFLCSGGLAEIRYGLLHGTQKPIPTPPGHIGKTVEVDARGYKPEFLPDDVAAPSIAEERARLMSTISKIVGL